MKTTKEMFADAILDSTDILNRVSKSLDYLEDNSEERLSALITIIHSDLDRAIDILKFSKYEEGPELAKSLSMNN